MADVTDVLPAVCLVGTIPGFFKTYNHSIQTVPLSAACQRGRLCRS